LGIDLGRRERKHGRRAPLDLFGVRVAPGETQPDDRLRLESDRLGNDGCEGFANSGVNRNSADSGVIHDLRGVEDDLDGDRGRGSGQGCGNEDGDKGDDPGHPWIISNRRAFRLLASPADFSRMDRTTSYAESRPGRAYSKATTDLCGEPVGMSASALRLLIE